MRSGSGLVAGAAIACVAVGAFGAGPAGAARPRACGPSKEWYTAVAEYQYATSLYSGQTSDAVTQGLSALGSRDQAAIQAALVNLTSGQANRSATFATATQTFLVKGLEALSQPPTCKKR